jgi:aspartate kinase
VHKNDFVKAQKILAETATAMGAKSCNGDEHIAKVAIVGAGMRSHAGVASKMFKTLADVGINIRMISTSEIKVAVVIDEKYLELAVRVLHDAFGLSQTISN